MKNELSAAVLNSGDAEASVASRADVKRARQGRDCAS